MTIRFDLGHDLDLEFSRSNMKLAISLPKWSDCHEMKSEHIDWTLGLKCDHQIWPWPWPWLWIFKVKYEICYISTKSGPIAMRRKANISIWTLGLKCDNGFDFGHDLDISIFKVICGLDHLVTKVRCKDLPDSDRGDFSCRCAVNSSSFHLKYEYGVQHKSHFMCYSHYYFTRCPLMTSQCPSLRDAALLTHYILVSRY